MTTNRNLFAVLAAAGVVIVAAVAACSSSSGAAVVSDQTVSDAAADVRNDSEAGGDDAGDDGPNVIPGQCVTNNGLWYCGAGYGTYPQCPGANPNPGQPCTLDGGCFVCYGGSGQAFTCLAGGWTLSGASGTGCSM